jgi:hypothetical protein
MSAPDRLARSFDTPGHAHVRVGVPEGIVEVEVVDVPRVDVEVTPLGRDSRVLEIVRIEATERAGTLEVAVQAQLERWGVRVSLRKVALRVHIACPPGTDLSVSSASTDVKGVGPLGSVEVKTASGDVVVQEVGSLAMQSASGDVVAREVRGDAVIKTTSGDLLVRDIGGGLEVATVSGDVEVGSVAGDLRVSAVSGDVRVGSAGGHATVNAVSGDVELAVPAGRRLWLDVRSASGDVRCDLDAADDVATGDAAVWEVTVRTVSGDVHLARASD